MKGPHGGSKLPKGWDNSRRARRARQALERANGSHELPGAQSGWAGGQEFDWGLGKTERIQRITGGCGPSPPLAPPFLRGGKCGVARSWVGGRAASTDFAWGESSGSLAGAAFTPPWPPLCKGGKVRVGLAGGA